MVPVKLIFVLSKYYVEKPSFALKIKFYYGSIRGMCIWGGC